MPGTRDFVVSARWFIKTFGFAEKTHDHTKEQFEFDPDRLVLTSLPNRKQFYVGPFEAVSLQTLQERRRTSRDTPALPELGGLRFRNIVSSTHLLHCDADNAGAVFQVMSLWNCLALREPGNTPEDKVTDYADDATQGSSCGIACPAATIFRTFFVDGRGQDKNHQVDCLAEVAERVRNLKEGYWTMKNGFCMPRPGGKLVQLGEKIVKDKILAEDIMQLVQVGIHWDTQVIDCAHHVCQVFCSTAPVGFSKMVKAVEWAPFATALLDAAYDAVLHAAALLSEQRGQRVKVYLTLLGGGALGNRKSWIYAAINKALHAHADDPLEVALVHHATAGSFAKLESQWQPPAFTTFRRRTISEDLLKMSQELSIDKLDQPMAPSDLRDSVVGASLISKAFAYFDANGDGVIDRKELGDVLQSLDSKIFTDDHIEQIVAKADADGDGVVHYIEFAAWVCNADAITTSRVLATAALAELGGIVSPNHRYPG